MLFAPAKRNDLLDDHANPIYDKEIRSEIFSQGTLMLRLVIQVSMTVAIPLMAVCLYVKPEYAAWFVGYVVVFNMLVGPVFNAGSVTSERERQTLDLLLVTNITPWRILWGKLIAGFRVSSVLTLFLVWPMLLACVMVHAYWSNLLTVLAYFGIILMTCMTTSSLALFCSCVFRKTSVSMMVTYLAIIVLFFVPLAINYFATQFFPDDPATSFTRALCLTSPLAAAFEAPLNVKLMTTDEIRPGTAEGWWMVGAHFLFTILLNLVLIVMMIWMFRVRWRVAY